RAWVMATRTAAKSCRSAFTRCSSPIRWNRSQRPMRDENVQVERPEFVAEVQKSFGVVEKPLTLWERIYENGAIRKGVLLLVLAAAWEIYARKLDNPLLFPTFSATVNAFWRAIASGVIPQRAWFSIKVLLQGYAAGLILAALLTAIATASRL